MFARITTVQYDPDRPEKMDEGTQIYATSIVPEIERQPGFKGILRLLNRSTGKALEITLWETETDAKAGILGNFVLEQLAKLASLTTGACSVGIYEVLSQESFLHTFALSETNIVEGHR